MPNYQNGKVYEVINDVKDYIYVGSTTKTLLSSRMAGHRCDARNAVRGVGPLYVAMRQIGIEHFTIRLIRAFPCDSKDELEAEENKTIEEYRRQGRNLYNLKATHHAPETIAKLVATHRAIARFGPQNPCFGHGAVNRNQNGVGNYYWIFVHREGGVRKAQHFSENVFGYAQAKWLAEQARKEHYPHYKTDEDQQIDQLLAIEV